MSFEGFTAEGLKFLFENKMNNSKDWYDSHKNIYKQFVYNPFIELVKEVAPVMPGIDSQLITIPSKLVSRVRRDTRFTHDKSLYRDNAWFVFLRDKSNMAASPCFWFELSQNGSSYGLGYYGAGPASMASMRKLIMDRHPAFLKALESYKTQDEFVIVGETYKRSKHPEQPENLKTWLDRKNIAFECAQQNFELAFSKTLPETLKKGFVKLKPIYDFFCVVESYCVTD